MLGTVGILGDLANVHPVRQEIASHLCDAACGEDYLSGKCFGAGDGTCRKSTRLTRRRIDRKAGSRNFDAGTLLGRKPENLRVEGAGSIDVAGIETDAGDARDFGANRQILRREGEEAKKCAEKWKKAFHIWLLGVWPGTGFQLGFDEVAPVAVDNRKIAQGFSGRERERGAEFVGAKLQPEILRLTTADRAFGFVRHREETITLLIFVDGAVEEIRQGLRHFCFAENVTVSASRNVDDFSKPRVETRSST